jgi:hypothetical protein
MSDPIATTLLHTPGLTVPDVHCVGGHRHAAAEESAQMLREAQDSAVRAD